MCVVLTEKKRLGCHITCLRWYAYLRLFIVDGNVTRELRRQIVVIAVLFLGVNGSLASQTEAQLFSTAQLARENSQFDVAISSLERLLSLNPNNADARVLLGFSYLANGQNEQARQSFESALVIASGYQDARYGLAQVAFREGDKTQALELLDTVLAAQPDNTDARLLVEKINAPPPKRWRLDVGTEVHTLTGGRPRWYEASTALSYQFEQGTTVSGSSRVANRGANTDTQLQIRTDHVFSPEFSAYGLFAGVPHANFLAPFSIGIGATWRLTEGTETFGPLLLNLNMRRDFYAAGPITAMRSGLKLFVFDDQLAMSADWLHSRDELGTFTNGYSIKVDMNATDQLRGFAGYSYSPEISGATTVTTQSIFAGLSYDLNDTTTLRGSYAHEMRQAFDRDTFNLGLSYRF